MHTTYLRKVGGSTMLAVPPAILDMLKLQAGATVGLTVNKGRLVVHPLVKPSYTLEELLSRFDPNGADAADDAWIDLAPAGNEL